MTPKKEKCAANDRQEGSSRRQPNVAAAVTISPPPAAERESIYAVAKVAQMFWEVGSPMQSPWEEALWSPWTESLMPSATSSHQFRAPTELTIIAIECDTNRGDY
jgi:hypothetical protein